MHSLFVDLDGVLADFETGVRDATGLLPHEQKPAHMWRLLARTPGFYEHLAWMPDGRELWAAVTAAQPKILTGLPLGWWAEPQKRAWCARELGPDVPVFACMSRAKARVAREHAPEPAIPVLIDDRESLRDAWEAMGGIFIHHTGASTSIAALGELAPSLLLEDS
jgi:hypothetical protein